MQEEERKKLNTLDSRRKKERKKERKEERN